MSWQQAGKLPVRAALAAHLKRYNWWRAYRGLTRHSKWRLVAARTKLPLERVTLIAIDLMDHAAAGNPRGSVAEFSVEEFAAHFGIDPEEVARVYAALEEVGWIDREYLTTWDERQPDKEDPTATERQQRRRERLRAERLSTGGEVSRVTGVTKRDVTPDQTRPKLKKGLGEDAAGEAEESLHTEPGESGENPEMALLQAVVECLEINPTSAQVKIARWKKTLGDDAQATSALVAIVTAAEATNLRGARFHNLITDQVARAVWRAQGPSLPLLPPRPKGRGYG